MAIFQVVRIALNDMTILIYVHGNSSSASYGLLHVCTYIKESSIIEVHIRIFVHFCNHATYTGLVVPSCTATITSANVYSRC